MPSFLFSLRYFLLPGFILLLTCSLLAMEWINTTHQGWLNWLIWIMTAAASLLSLVYGRSRNLVAILLFALTYGLLTQQVYQPLLRGDRGLLDPEITYLLISFLLPLLLLVNAFLTEHRHLLTDLLLRLVLLTLTALLVILPSHYFSAPMKDLLSGVHISWLFIPDLGIAQLPLLMLMLTVAALLFQYWRQASPYLAAEILALTTLCLALPHFMQPPWFAALTLGSLILLTLALIHESFEMAFLDGLTGLPGRRALNERLQRLGNHYAIAMSDVDHFKKFNDTHGHDMGDDVLRVVAAQLRRVGGGGKAYRYGGEEFALVFPGKKAQQVVPELERLRIGIEHQSIHVRDVKKRPADNQQGRKQRGTQTGKQVSVTISMGVAERNEQASTPEEVIKAADQALYKAKQAGRNCIEVHGTSKARKRRTPAKK